MAETDGAALSRLPGDEALYLRLCALYGSCGYQNYRMNKFEEYSLYLDHKNFLTSPSILTFTEPDGRLMALRPDVTLSIVKNSRATPEYTEKLYYRENVYRLDRTIKSYREIGQIGVEAIGSIDRAETAEIVSLAAGTLAAVDSDFVLSISHTGFLAGLLDYAGIDSEAGRETVSRCLREQNSHELSRNLSAHGVDAAYVDKLSRLLTGSLPFARALDLAGELAVNEPMKKAVSEMRYLCLDLQNPDLIRSLRFDLTVQSDLHYYFGLIMQGYVKNCPRSVLSGGRYDKLLRKFNRPDGRPVGAMGFALVLGDLPACYPGDAGFDFDVLLLYSEDDAPDRVAAMAGSLRAQGLRVRIAKNNSKEMPRCRQIIRMDGGESASC